MACALFSSDLAATLLARSNLDTVDFFGLPLTFEDSASIRPSNRSLFSVSADPSLAYPVGNFLVGSGRFMVVELILSSQFLVKH